mmetsp:Transcript_159864/g.388222  ORF Transcript_159864/g.388222 Transcript_159864/m.388222 type:complete len:251 (+) Transcript_159864:71-823(+)
MSCTAVQQEFGGSIVIRAECAQEGWALGAGSPAMHRGGRRSCNLVFMATRLTPGPSSHQRPHDQAPLRCVEALEKLLKHYLLVVDRELLLESLNPSLWIGHTVVIVCVQILQDLLAALDPVGDGGVPNDVDQVAQELHPLLLLRRVPQMYHGLHPLRGGHLLRVVLHPAALRHVQHRRILKRRAVLLGQLCRARRRCRLASRLLGRDLRRNCLVIRVFDLVKFGIVQRHGTLRLAAGERKLKIGSRGEEP